MNRISRRCTGACLAAALVLAACGGGADRPATTVADARGARTSDAARSSSRHTFAAAPATPASAPTCELALVDWLEPVVQKTGTAGFALRQGRAVTLRAVVKTRGGTTAAAPAVHVRVKAAGGALLGQGDMTPPASGQVGKADPAGLDDNYRYALPAAWVAPGMTVDVELDPGAADARKEHLAPQVGPPAVLYLTVVPMSTVDEGTAVLPAQSYGAAATRATIRSTLMSAYPLTDVKIRIHAPHAASHDTMLNNWGYLLGDMDRLWAAEGEMGFYMGFVPRPSGFTATVGNSFTPGTITTVLGPRDSDDTSWKGTARHEFGHNMGFFHPAACGAGYTIGEPGGRWGYDADAGTTMDLDGYQNIMSYCDPAWIGKPMYDATNAAISAHGLATPPADVLDQWQ